MVTGTRNAPPGEAARWYQRVLPVTALALVLVALAAASVPGFRHQLALSASHQSEAYVELAFARGTTGPPVTCERDAGAARVVFDVTSHLADTASLDYEVAVGSDQDSGSVRVEPGRTAQVSLSLGSAKRPYEVLVRLPASGDELRAHCPGPAQGTAR